MNYRFCLIIAMLFAVHISFSQGLAESPKGFKLRETQRIVFVYRNQNEKPETSVRNIWSYAYWFKVDSSRDGRYQDPNTKEWYRRITIPSGSRFDDAIGKWVSETSETKSYQLLVPWVQDQKIDGSDFNTWLWISEVDFNDLKSDYAPKKMKRDFVLSGLTVPFKYRPATGMQSNSVINGDINLGSLIGLRISNWIAKDLGISIGGHFGLSSIALNASNNTSLIEAKAETIQGFTYGGGIIFDVKNQFQIGLVRGYDYGTGNLAKTYVYQQKGWWSFSLNYNFLKGKKETDTNEKAAKGEKKDDKNTRSTDPKPSE